MKIRQYKSLKSGTDIRGIAVKTELSDVTLTLDAINDLTSAFLKWLSLKTGKKSLKIAVGCDIRISGDSICAAVLKRITDCGCDAVYCGVSSTPCMFVLLKESDWECDGSIMVTASHLPYDRNGLKFFTHHGGIDSVDLDRIIEFAERGEKLPKGQGSVEEKSYMDEYCRKLLSVVRTATGKSAPLFGKRIIVDASNGVGGFFVKKVLQQLGAITEGSINLNPDGNFPSHAPNPEAPEAIAALCDAVTRARADLGIIFDTDVDRAAIVDGDGKPINRDRLIALTAATILGERPATIVTDSVTSEGLTEFIESLGGKHVRYKRGYRNVIGEAMNRTANGEFCPLAMETSGHASFADNYYLDDGAYLVCKLLVAYTLQSLKKEKLCDLISGLNTPLEEKEIRVRFSAKSQDFRREGARVLDEVEYFADMGKELEVDKDNVEGVRLKFRPGHGDGWALIRMSLHDPVMPIYFASREEGGVAKMAKSLYYLLDKYPFMFIGELKKFVDEK